MTRTWVRPPDWEGWLAVVALLHGANAFDFLLGPGPVDTALWLLLYLTVVGLFWYRYRLQWLPWLLRHQPLLCAVLALAAASWFWSIAPEFTWKRAIHLLGTTLIGVYIGYRFAPRSLMGILFYSFVILIVCSVAFALFLPEYGQSSFRQGGTVWIGLTENKNQLGLIAAIAAVLFLVGTLFGRIPPLPGIGLTALSSVALAMTESATAMVVLPVGVLTVAIFVLSKRIRAPSILTLILVLAGGVGVALFVATTDYVYDFTELLGRDAKLTGRAEIWAAAWHATLDRPWLGWGYGTLWSVTDESAFVQQNVLEATSWRASHAHNGVLNISSELGIPAAAAGILYLLVVLYRSTRLYVKRASPFVLFSMAVALQMLILNIPESFMFTHREFIWILFLAVAVAVSRSAVWNDPGNTKVATARRHQSELLTTELIGQRTIVI